MLIWGRVGGLRVRVRGFLVFELRGVVGGAAKS